LQARVLIAPLTTYRVLDYIDVLKDSVEDSLKSAGVESEVLAVPSPAHISMKCYDWERRQYFAPCVLSELKAKFSVLQGVYVIGVGYMDGYDKGLNFVFGEADPHSSVAVVFTKRLDPLFYGKNPDYNLYVERTVKEIVHELGHLLGLGHCSLRECVMSFSNSVYEVDLKTRFFCSNCRSKLKSALS